MKKALLAAAALAALVLVAGALVWTVPPLRDEAEWQLASFRDGATDYAEYLRERPDGRHADDARRKHDDKVFQQAEGADTIPAYEAYLAAYVHGRHAQDARNRIDGIRWERAKATNTVESYKAYLAASPEGAYVAEAQSRFRDLRWKRTAAQIANRACAGASGRAVVLYRAPSLSPRLAGNPGAQHFIPYVVRVPSAPPQGWGEIAKEPCKQLDVLGGTKQGHWAFVTLQGKPATRGWVRIANASGVNWSIVPPVPADTLLRRTRSLPDLAFGDHRQAFQIGEECFGLGDVNVWDLVLRNQGAGAGPDAVRLRILPSVPHYVEGRRVDTSRVVTLRFARPFLPGESFTVSGIPFQSRVELDPTGAVRESDEGNNSLSLSQPSFYLTCESR